MMADVRLGATDDLYCGRRIGKEGRKRKGAEERS
jgi:hypothetical protein